MDPSDPTGRLKTNPMAELFTSSLLAFAGVIFFGIFVQTVAGFGAILIIVSLGSFLMPVSQTFPLAVPFALALSTYVLLRHGKRAEWPFLLKRILPFMILGLVVGQLAFAGLNEQVLRVLLGLVVLGASGLELARHLRLSTEIRPLSGPVATGWLLGAGVMHGIFGIGGPALVYVVGRQAHDKGALRATLAVVWVTLNCALVASFLVQGRLSGEEGAQLGALLPAFILALPLGEWVHHRVPERPFRLGVYILLALAGGGLLFR